MVLLSTNIRSTIVPCHRVHSYSTVVSPNRVHLSSAVVSLCPAQVAEEMRGRTLALYDQGLSLDGRSVDYSGLEGSRVYQEYVALAEELQKVSAARTVLFSESTVVRTAPT